MYSLWMFSCISMCLHVDVAICIASRLVAEYPLFTSLGQQMIVEAPVITAGWCASQCSALMVHPSDDVKMATLMKLFGKAKLPVSTTAVSPGAASARAPTLSEPSLTTRGTWQALLMCKNDACWRVVRMRSTCGSYGFCAGIFLHAA